MIISIKKAGINKLVILFFTKVGKFKVLILNTYPDQKKNNGIWNEYNQKLMLSGQNVCPSITSKMPIPLALSIHSTRKISTPSTNY